LQETEGKPDGGSVQMADEFKQIPESNLLAYLREGWTIIKELANGDLIVKR